MKQFISHSWPTVHPSHQPRMVDVIVPAYRDFETTRACVEAVLAAPVSTSFELVVVDDASPEEALADWLNQQASAGRLTLVRNDSNRGFVASVNRGMSLHPDRDVVLLNSDTEVSNDWLDRIVRCARSAPMIATVTPFSNNGTICSYPFDGWQGATPGTLGLAGLDALFADKLAGRMVDIPTAVGFCMFIRRDCLIAIGAFNEQVFGRGYGEENDFSLRAANAGWRNVLCADTFVYHQGGASFGSERAGLLRNAAQALLALHPDYDERVVSFLASDPVSEFREVIDMARARLGGDEGAAVAAERHRERQAWRVPPTSVCDAPRSMRLQWLELLDASAMRLEQGQRADPVRSAILAKACRGLSVLLRKRKP